MDTEWKLLRAETDPPPVLSSSPPLGASAELLEARLLELAPGQPYLVRPDGSIDGDVFLYCDSESFRRLAPGSQLGYAHNLRSYLSFLDQRGVDWRHATGEDLVAYERWRRHDPGNPRPISTATYARELTAVRRFYAWQLRHGAVESLPVLEEWVLRPDGTIGPAADARPGTMRSSRPMWLTSTEYRRWRDVGLRGSGVDNRRDSSWRSRNARRNLAFADTLWSSGLSLSEGSTLLTWEVPEESHGKSFSRGRLALSAGAGTVRDFWISDEALRAIDAYRTTDRAAAVQRARRQGRYNDPGGITVVEPDRVSLEHRGVEERRRMFIEGDGGLEPASLWLTDVGMPVNQVSWENVFQAANARCASAGVEVHCRPQVLRHSFAFRILVAWQRSAVRRSLPGDPFVLIQTLLGHGSVQTTHSLYRDLDVEEHERIWQALNEDPDASLSDLLVQQVAETHEREEGGEG